MITADAYHYTVLLAEMPRLHDEIDHAATALAAALRARTYRGGDEYTAADALLTTVTDDEVPRALWAFVCERISHDFMDVNLCVLNNAADHGYQVVTAAAKVLYDGIVEEWAAEERGLRGALWHFIVETICDRSEVAA